MRNIKAILAGALIAPALALTGGIAYASTTTGSTPAPARTAVTATAQAQYGYGCDWRQGDRCDQRGHGYQRHAYQQRTHQRHAYQQRSHQRHAYRHHAYRTGNGYGYRGYQGNWGSQGGNWGSGQHGSGSRWSGGGDCGHGW